MVAQVHEQQIAVVALAMNPTGETGGVAGILDPKLAAGVGTVSVHETVSPLTEIAPGARTFGNGEKGIWGAIRQGWQSCACNPAGAVRRRDKPGLDTHSAQDRFSPPPPLPVAGLGCITLAHANDRRLPGTGRLLRAAVLRPVHYRRYGIHAGKDLFPAIVPGSGRRPRRGPRHRPAGARHRSDAAVRPAGRAHGAQGVPRRPPGYRDFPAPDRQGAGAAVRHPGGGHGVRLRRFGRLRDAGQPVGQGAHRQVHALHRLVAAAADGKAGAVRTGRRHPPARRL